ncbi:MAG: TetR/AcrR family transcriptional regulator [Bacteroidales bacterium]|jgi:AcrR family transcriptional regulator|nr:TetR/AcrR family transcriptional regulator [Bacteroidales bacterium]
MKKIEKSDWFVEGLNVLATDGFAKITIDNLCTILNVTKGSFYHHFGSVDGYIDRLMTYWMEKNTVDFIKTTDSIVDVGARYGMLREFASLVSQKAEQVIRAWSFSNETVRRYVQQVDGMRMKYLTDLSIQIGIDAKEAELYTTMEYGIMIGVQQLKLDISQEDFRNLFVYFRDVKFQKMGNKEINKL